MRKKNILIVHNYYQIPGGEDVVVDNEMKLLLDNGHKVILYTRHNSEINKMSLLKKLMLPLIHFFNIRTYYDIKKIIKKEKIEIVHVHNTLNLISPAVYYAALKLKVPVVQTLHNFRLVCPGATLYRNGKICEKCLSNGIINAVKHSCYRNSKIQTLICVIGTTIHHKLGIYNKLYFISLTEFNMYKILSGISIDKNRMFVKPNFTYDNDIKERKGQNYLYIGRIEDMKGVSTVLDAFSKLTDRKLILIGNGPKYTEYKNKFSFADNIEFKGFLNKDQLKVELKNAKAVIVASNCYESFGMTIIEAFSAKVPVIASNIGNFNDLIVQGVNGVKFKSNSTDSLIQQIYYFESLDNAALGRNAYKDFLNKYNPETNYTILNDIYNTIK